MATFKETQNSLVFFSAKAFLDSIDTLFEYRYSKVEGADRFVFEHRSLGGEWKRKAISVCVKDHELNSVPNEKFYQLISAPNEGLAEAEELLRLQEFLNHKVLEVTASNGQPLTKTYSNVSQLKIFPPFRFTTESFSRIQKEPGTLCLKIGNGWQMDSDVKGYYYGAFLSFNSWKFRVVLKRKAVEQLMPEVKLSDVDVNVIV